MCVCIICAYVCSHLYVTFLHLDVLILIVDHHHTVYCSCVDRQMDGRTEIIYFAGIYQPYIPTENLIVIYSRAIKHVRICINAM